MKKGCIENGLSLLQMQFLGIIEGYSIPSGSFWVCETLGAAFVDF